MPEVQKIRDRIDVISSQIQSGANRLEHLRGERTRLKKELVKQGVSQREVCDHAVLRYLERIKGVDVEAAREELRQMADEADGFKGKKNEHHWHEGTGLVLLLNKEGGVITVLSEEQSEKHIGRKLKNGNYVVRPETEDEPAPSSTG